MSPAVWLVLLPIGAIPLTYLLRKARLGAFVAGGLALLQVRWRAADLDAFIAGGCDMDRLEALDRKAVVE